MSESLTWLERAKSNLIIGKSINIDGVALEDLCFELQQCAEKSLKALLIYHNVTFPKTHNLLDLIQLLKDNTNVKIPNFIAKATKLTLYATQTRYPDFTERISKEKYNEAIELAETVYKWVEEQVK